MDVMDTSSPKELELAELIITAVQLEEVNPEEIDPGAPLFGDGLGLDSIDALEIALAISRKYGFELTSDNGNDAREIFASLRTLCEHVEQYRAQ